MVLHRYFVQSPNPHRSLSHYRHQSLSRRLSHFHYRYRYRSHCRRLSHFRRLSLDPSPSRYLRPDVNLNRSYCLIPIRYPNLSYCLIPSRYLNLSCHQNHSLSQNHYLS